MKTEIKVYPSEDENIESTALTNKEYSEIEHLILTIRNTQVIIDRDLARLYGVETKVLNQAVKRNIARFPEDFRFKLTKEECLRSQFVTLNEERGHHLKYLPYAFTEQGVAMLSAILKSETAIAVSIEIIKAFVTLRHMVNNSIPLFKRVDIIELRQLQTDNKVNKIINQLNNYGTFPTQGIFFNGQVFDAYQFVSDLIRSAQHSVVLFDNYADDSVLTQLTKRRDNVAAAICVSRLSEGLQLDVKRHNAQYPPVLLCEISSIHDRFLLIDKETLYTFGASFKDLGKKLFCFTKIESPDLIATISNLIPSIT